MFMLTFAVIFTIYILYNVYVNKQINNYAGTYIKNDIKKITNKTFYQ